MGKAFTLGQWFLSLVKYQAHGEFYTHCNDIEIAQGKAWALIV